MMKIIMTHIGKMITRVYNSYTLTLTRKYMGTKVMATFPCSIEEFNIAFCAFNAAIGNKSNTQEGIANMYKGLQLHYLGLQNVTDEEIERCAVILEVATREATYRGWSIFEANTL